MRTRSLGWVRTLAKLKSNLLKLIVGPRSRVAAMAENAKALEKHGVNQHREAGHYNCNILNGEGNNATYLTARIARDRPDILADMKAVIEMQTFHFTFLSFYAKLTEVIQARMGRAKPGNVAKPVLCAFFKNCTLETEIM